MVSKCIEKNISSQPEHKYTFIAKYLIYDYVQMTSSRNLYFIEPKWTINSFPFKERAYEQLWITNLSLVFQIIWKKKKKQKGMN